MPLRLVKIHPSHMHMNIADIKLNWSSIFSGAFLTLGFEIFFILLGNAVGLNVANSVRGDISGALKFWSWIYLAATFIFSYYLGGFLCTRSAAIDTPGAGIIHGLTAWGLASTVFIGIASLSSIGMRILLAGFAVNSANWLAVCIVGLGGIAAGYGGLVGKYSRHGMVPSEQVTGQRAA